MIFIYIPIIKLIILYIWIFYLRFVSLEISVGPFHGTLDGLTNTIMMAPAEPCDHHTAEPIEA